VLSLLLTEWAANSGKGDLDMRIAAGLIGGVGVLLTTLILVAIGKIQVPDRLILGARGFALCRWEVEAVVLWEELGTVWRIIHADSTPDYPLSVVLEHRDGTRLAITSHFGDHHVVVLRILEELPRRVPGRQASPQNATSDAIKPGEHGLTEPGI
jgi:hypothetical protein